MDKFGNKKLAIIGGGHIGLALVEGLINSGKIVGSQIIVANPSESKIAHLKKQGVETTTDNRIAAANADWIFLAVKPFVVDHVLSEISDLVKDKLVISLAAVVVLNTLKRRAKEAKIMRIMPNMAISCNQGVIGLYAKAISDEDKIQIKNLLASLGMVIEVSEEKDLNALTLLSGCGPAIVSQFIEMVANYGTSVGLSPAIGQRLALQTFKGTAALLENSGLSPGELIQSISTKGGITEAILSKLKQRAFQNRFLQSMHYGYTKIQELDRNVNRGAKHFLRNCDTLSNEGKHYDTKRHAELANSDISKHSKGPIGRSCCDA